MVINSIGSATTNMYQMSASPSRTYASSIKSYLKMKSAAPLEDVPEVSRLPLPRKILRSSVPREQQKTRGCLSDGLKSSKDRRPLGTVSIVKRLWSWRLRTQHPKNKLKLK
ncbi:hypothetical protein PoB_000240200 [Plakobranchus ocellatus]|uniref:Uncharacterized protein n=1 Tax=Plakobranchus ocellatus TaxID=259542 RepID=A0AAV3Y0C9_9GAST|nr:hypothetical protein PoB_000240200 [Plakobranchus ocellatus]